ncbi:MAG TPA: hypothetical protein EYP78_06260 [Candidatus Omnitrophica bacterium]|nr:hypothetical protein [Candidatus Omnitrophota bacterium]
MVDVEKEGRFMDMLYLTILTVNLIFLILLLIIFLEIKLARMEKKLDSSDSTFQDVKNVVTLILSHAKDVNNHSVKIVERLSHLLMRC